MKSQTDLINRALTILGAAGTGQPVQPEDFAKMRAILPGLMDEVTGDGTVSLTFTDDIATEVIPDKYMTGLATLLALDAGPDVISAPAATDEQREAAKMTLRRLSAIGPTYNTLAADYF